MGDIYKKHFIKWNLPYIFQIYKKRSWRNKQSLSQSDSTCCTAFKYLLRGIQIPAARHPCLRDKFWHRNIALDPCMNYADGCKSKFSGHETTLLQDVLVYELCCKMVSPLCWSMGGWACNAEKANCCIRIFRYCEKYVVAASCLLIMLRWCTST